MTLPLRPVAALADAASRPSRRDTLAGLGAMGAALASVAPAAAQGPPAGSLAGIIASVFPEGQRFVPAGVVEVARQLSRRPYVAPSNDLPDAFAGLTYEQYVSIRGRPGTRIWEDEGRGFMAEPLPRGFVFSTAVTLFAVEEGGIRRLAFDRNRFDFGTLNVPANTPDLGFSGFRLIATAGGPAFDFAIVQGATFFRAVARGQNYGITARALALKPAEARGEEFPLFRAFWLERPAAGSNAVVVHGLIDSVSTTGAVRMTFRPGESTIIDVETTLFPRVALEHVGLGGMGSIFLHGPNVRRATDDVRPAVYEAAGLQMLNGGGEWLWRPINNPDTLQISAFQDENPKGFGLLQRDRDFAFFADDIQRWERRPSLWIEPLGDWGPGAVQLIEIPSDSEVNSNILAYWRPRVPMAAGSEVTIAYRQFWCWTPPERPALAAVSSTRSGRGSGGRRRRFTVEFVGDGLASPPADMRPILTTSPGTIANARLWLYADRRTARVTFELDPGSETACEMRLLLQAGTRPLSETWLYRWTP